MFRGQRLAVFLAALAPFAANPVFLARGSSNVSDPTPLGFAAAGSVMWYATFRRDLLTFSPVARALIIDQISDAVVVISPNDRVLDVNPTANDLLRAMNPDAPTTLVGAPAMASKSGGTSAVACGPAPVSIQQTDGVSASTASHPDRSERKRLP